MIKSLLLLVLSFGWIFGELVGISGDDRIHLKLVDPVSGKTKQLFESQQIESEFLSNVIDGELYYFFFRFFDYQINSSTVALVSYDFLKNESSNPVVFYPEYGQFNIDPKTGNLLGISDFPLQLSVIDPTQSNPTKSWQLPYSFDVNAYPQSQFKCEWVDSNSTFYATFFDRNNRQYVVGINSLDGSILLNQTLNDEISNCVFDSTNNQVWAIHTSNSQNYLSVIDFKTWQINDVAILPYKTINQNGGALWNDNGKTLFSFLINTSAGYFIVSADNTGAIIYQAPTDNLVSLDFYSGN